MTNRDMMKMRSVRVRVRVGTRVNRRLGGSGWIGCCWIPFRCMVIGGYGYDFAGGVGLHRVR
jgi:hypothetical protein